MLILSFNRFKLPMNPLHITLLQMDLAWHDPEANRQLAESMLQTLDGSTDIILLPEMFTTGFTNDVETNYEMMEGKTQDWMHQMAHQYKAWIGGSLIIKEKGSYYNRFLMVDEEDIVVEYDKRHLFRMADEHDYYMEGEEFVRCEWKDWRLAPLICYDLRFPVWSRNKADHEGRLSYDLLIYVANWPKPRIAHWEALLKARAIENQCYVAAVNRVGVDGKNIEYSGSSMIVNPFGEVIAYNSGDQTVLSAALDPEPLIKFRTKLPFWKDTDNFEVFI